MNKQRILLRTVVAAVLGALSVSGTALAIDEKEQNHPIGYPHALSEWGNTSVSKDGITVYGVLGSLADPAAPTAPGDVDFYSFYAEEGDVLTFDIDAGMGGERNVNTYLAIFEVAPTFIKRDETWKAASLDEGSTSIFDARIDKYRIRKTGIYTVGVSSFPRALGDGGIFLNTTTNSLSHGDYILVISPESPPVLQISIEVKPGSGERAPLNPNAKGNIPVALLSSALPAFNPFVDVEVSRESLTFGSTGTETSLRKCEKEGFDLNGDGVPDMVCHFESQDAKFKPDASRAYLKGKTKNGRAFEAGGMLKVVPPKLER